VPDPRTRGWDGWRLTDRPAVMPAWRRRGVARLLVAHAEDRLRTLGARRVAAMVITEHDQAVGDW
jgi:GNAT superfamily N-acetyltransferase